MSTMTVLPRCSCCAYSAVKDIIKRRSSDYDSIMSRFKAAERQLEKIDTQIGGIKEDITRKAQTATQSSLIKGDKERELLDLAGMSINVLYQILMTLGLRQSETQAPLLQLHVMTMPRLNLLAGIHIQRHSSC